MLGEHIPPSLLLVHQTLNVRGPTPPLCGTSSPEWPDLAPGLLQFPGFCAKPHISGSSETSQSWSLSVPISQDRVFPRELGYLWGGILSYMEAASGLQDTGPPYTLAPWLDAHTA